MSFCLESKALRTVTDEGLQKLDQSLNKPGPGDNLMAMQKAKTPFVMSNG